MQLEGTLSSLIIIKTHILLFLMHYLGELRGLLELIMNNTKINIRISIFHHKSQYFLANVSMLIFGLRG